MKTTKIHSVRAEQDARGKGYLVATILSNTDIALMASNREWATFEDAEREAAYLSRIVDENGMCGAVICEDDWTCISSTSLSLESDVAQGAWRDGL